MQKYFIIAVEYSACHCLYLILIGQESVFLYELLNIHTMHPAQKPAFPSPW
jgi:hypothetical protein